MSRPSHFAQIDDDRYQPGPFAQSHWGEDHLNGPAVVGLAAYTLEAAYGLPDFLPARLTVDLFRAARGVPTTCKTSLIRDGRRVRNSECELVQDGVTVARATLVQYRLSEAPRGEEWVRTTEFAAPPELDEARGINIASDGLGWTFSIADHQNARAQTVFQPHHQRRRRCRELRIRPCRDGRRRHQPGDQPGYRGRRLHQR